MLMHCLNGLRFMIVCEVVERLYFFRGLFFIFFSHFYSLMDVWGSGFWGLGLELSFGVGVFSWRGLGHRVWGHLGFSGFSDSLGQHNFEFRSVSRYHESGSEAGLISHFTNLPQLIIMRLNSIRISHFMCAWRWPEAGNHTYFILLLSSARVMRAA